MKTIVVSWHLCVFVRKGGMLSRFDNRFNMWIDRIANNIIALNRCVAHVHCFSMVLFTFYKKIILNWIKSATFNAPRVENAFIYSSSINSSMRKHAFDHAMFFLQNIYSYCCYWYSFNLCFILSYKKAKSIVSSIKCMHRRVRCARLQNRNKKCIHAISIPFLRNVYHFSTLVLSHKQTCSL